MDRKRQGAVGEAMAIAYYSQNGYVVSVPVADIARYDLIVDSEQGLKRVQVKSTGYKKNRSTAYYVGFATSGGNQSWDKVRKHISAEETDLVFVYALDGQMWEFPVVDCAGSGGMFLGKKGDENKVFFRTVSIPPPPPLEITRRKRKSNTRILEVKLCSVCGKKVDPRAITGICRACHSRSPLRPTKISWPETGVLIDMIEERNCVQVAKELGVSDSSVRKRIKNHPIIL